MATIGMSSAWRVAGVMCVLAACPGGGGGDPTATSGASTDASTGDATSEGTAGTDGTGGTIDPGPTTSATTGGPTSGTDSTGGPTATSDDPTDTAGTTTVTSGDTTTGTTDASVTVHLVPQPGVSGMQRINFAVPLTPGQLADDQQIQVHHGGTELATALRGLARHPDDSWRSVQIQVDLDLAGETDLDLVLNAAPGAGSIDAVPVADTLVDDATGPNVWTLFPPQWLSQSGVAGPLTTEADAEGTPGAIWAQLCDYGTWGHDAFIPLQGQADVWLYDRGTTLYRGHARRGDLDTLRSAYLETTIYRNGLTGSGPDTEIGVPGKVGDAKYYYSQNMAIHYLLTGDDRFRDSAEDVAEAYAGLWADPGYAGGADFWTERHAGFALLAYVWTLNVTDDKADQFRQLADEAVTAYIDVQETYPMGYADPDARCFAHHGDAAGEDYPYFGCSPWLSAILADGLDQYATETSGAQGDAARTAIVKLGRIIARDGLDDGGKPFYWMGVGNGEGAVDDYDEHWGEPAYVVAMAYHHDGGADPELESTVMDLIDGLTQYGEVPHMRSFNWQCRSAIATPAFLAP